MSECCIFDPPFCVAMWASDGHGHQRGEICGQREDVKQLGDAWLCNHHYWRSYDAVIHEEWIKRERRRRTGPDYGGEEWAPDAAEVVYYVRRLSDGYIKIGRSAVLRLRLRQLRGEHGPLELLLTHRGGVEREHQMHRKFARYRADGEFFRPRTRLMAWIIQLRQAQNPDSWLRGTVPMDDLLALAEAQKSVVKQSRGVAVYRN